jgi:hypothetical protein
VLGAALVAGILAWGIGELMHDYYGPSVEALRSRFDFSAQNREQRAADQKNAAIAFGTFGALLGLLTGAAGGAARRSIAAAAGAALLGLLLGAIGGALVSYELSPVFTRYYRDTEPMFVPLLVRGGIWAVVGMTAGVALGCGWHGPRGLARALTGGLVGSVFGTIGFEVVNALIFPMERNDRIIPSSSVTRLIAYLCVAVCVALGTLILQPGERAGRAVSREPTRR